VVFDTLMSWTASANDAVKYYSGTAAYTKTFELDAFPAAQRVCADLGKVMVIAKVAVNGIDVGGVWTAPYEVDITKAVRPGQNTIKIKVTNNWMNRLIGDSALPPGQGETWISNNPFKPGSALQTSGLTGPVSLKIYDTQ
jgi:beta-galactosidase/beta-glucuronidase